MHTCMVRTHFFVCACGIVRVSITLLSTCRDLNAWVSVSASAARNRPTSASSSQQGIPGRIRATRQSAVGQLRGAALASSHTPLIAFNSSATAGSVKSMTSAGMPKEAEENISGAICACGVRAFVRVHERAHMLCVFDFLWIKNLFSGVLSCVRALARTLPDSFVSCLIQILSK